jgi:hypothetical protein
MLSLTAPIQMNWTQQTPRKTGPEETIQKMSNVILPTFAVLIVLSAPDTPLHTILPLASGAVLGMKMPMQRARLISTETQRTTPVRRHREAAASLIITVMAPAVDPLLSFGVPIPWGWLI